jgi:hypothetical protein
MSTAVFRSSALQLRNNCGLRKVVFLTAEKQLRKCGKTPYFSSAAVVPYIDISTAAAAPITHTLAGSPKRRRLTRAADTLLFVGASPALCGVAALRSPLGRRSK